MHRPTSSHPRGVSDPGPASAREDESVRQLILDHASHPRHFGALADADRDAIAESPTCGDRYRVFVRLDGPKIERVQFVGRGCSISMASASIMSLAVQQANVAEARAILEHFQQFLIADSTESQAESLGDLVAFAGLRHNPLRVRCATLPWTALMTALGEPTDRT